MHIWTKSGLWAVCSFFFSIVLNVRGGLLFSELLCACSHISTSKLSWLIKYVYILTCSLFIEPYINIPHTYTGCQGETMLKAVIDGVFLLPQWGCILLQLPHPLLGFGFIPPHFYLKKTLFLRNMGFKCQTYWAIETLFSPCICTITCWLLKGNILVVIKTWQIQIGFLRVILAFETTY